ncbi:nicastrin [Elysia marginata]|uniref:Nicastrin n=1 Tax=Elysia marginata TaxID=1093978 RepID=A0AAV4GA29_9GAST|nr:nicastrin [Elysia marginata]
MQWNSAGSGLMREDLGIPVFALSDESDVFKVLHKCFFKFNLREKNETAREYPLCAAELNTKMYAAIDTETCLRRSRHFSFLGKNELCDPMGDKNNHVTMLNIPQNETRADDSVIVVGARLDSASLFTLEYQASDTSVTGFVSLLAAMEALWKVKDKIRKTKNAKDIMFAFFHGEAYDYIGSSSMVYSMTQGTFPQDLDHGLHLHKIQLQHIHQLVELNQVGYRDNEGSLWLHTDPNNRKTKLAQIQKMIDGLQDATQGLNVTLQEADATLPLPPASSQRFLMEQSDIPVVVVTDHQTQFTNKFYNSRLDLPELINATDYSPDLSKADKYDHVTKQAELIAELSTALARYLYQASTGAAPDATTEQTLTANSSTVTHMLYCFLVSPNCELFKETVSPVNAESLKTTVLPYPFYVGVYSSQQTRELSTLVYSLMARFTGDKVDLSESDCKENENDKRYSYLYVQGTLKGKGQEREGWCLKSLVHKSDALSPAFIIDGYDWKSGKYSTWTESRWGGESDSIRVRLFLVPSKQLQVSILVFGIVVLVLSLLIVYWCSIHATHIFTNRLTGSGTQSTYSPMF